MGGDIINNNNTSTIEDEWKNIKTSDVKNQMNDILNGIQTFINIRCVKRTISVDTYIYVSSAIDKLRICLNYYSEMEPDNSVYSTLHHICNERDWFKKRMNQYKTSFFDLCNFIEKSNNLEEIKELVKEECRRY